MSNQKSGLTFWAILCESLVVSRIASVQNCSSFQQVPPYMLAHPTSRMGTLHPPSLPSDRQYQRYDDCLEHKREDYQNYSVLHHVPKLCTMVCTHTHKHVIAMSKQVGMQWVYMH